MNVIERNEQYAAFLSSLNGALKAHKTLATEAAALAPVLKVADDAAKLLFLNECATRVATHYQSQVSIGKHNRPRVDDEAGHKFFERYCIRVMQDLGVTFPGDRAKAEGETEKQKATDLARLLADAMRLLSWADYTKMRDQMTKNIEAHARGEL